MRAVSSRGSSPALLLLTVMFVFHLHGNRREMALEARTASKEAEIARARTRELEQLMTFGQSLNRALSDEALHEAIWRHLPALANGAEIWMLVRTDGEWERITDRARSRWIAGELEAIANGALGRIAETESAEGFEHEGFICFAIDSTIRKDARLRAAAATFSSRTARSLSGSSLIV